MQRSELHQGRIRHHRTLKCLQSQDELVDQQGRVHPCCLLFSANAQREVDEQLAVFDRYIDLFESCMVRLAAGAKQEVHCA